jgi:hypothetical protein
LADIAAGAALKITSIPTAFLITSGMNTAMANDIHAHQ